MGNEESIGQSADFGQFQANQQMMFNQRQQQQQQQAFRPLNKPQQTFTRPPTAPAMSPGPGPGPPLPDVDLSGLTEEERLMIQSVMARAEQETGGEVSVSPVVAPPKPAMNSTTNSNANINSQSRPFPRTSSLDRHNETVNPTANQPFARPAQSQSYSGQPSGQQFPQQQPQFPTPSAQPQFDSPTRRQQVRGPSHPVPSQPPMAATVAADQSSVFGQRSTSSPGQPPIQPDSYQSAKSYGPTDGEEWSSRMQTSQQWPQSQGTGRKMPQMPSKEPTNRQQFNQQTDLNQNLFSQNQQFPSSNRSQPQERQEPTSRLEEPIQNQMQEFRHEIRQQYPQEKQLQEVQRIQPQLQSQQFQSQEPRLQQQFQPQDRPQQPFICQPERQQQIIPQQQQHFQPQPLQQQSQPQHQFQPQPQPQQQQQQHFQQCQPQQQHFQPQSQPQHQFQPQPQQQHFQSQQSQPQPQQQQQQQHQFQPQPQQHFQQSQQSPQHHSQQHATQQYNRDESKPEMAYSQEEYQLYHNQRNHINQSQPSVTTTKQSAPIPRTVPLHTVTQQLATSSSSSSPTSSPKHKPITGQQQLQPKKTPPQVPECWSPPSDLSPILDVSPSVEAAEQEIMERIKSSGQALPTQHVMPNIPRATSGTITGMIADFNKAMEALGTNSSPTEEQFQLASKLQRLEKSSKHNQKPSETVTTGPQPIIVMTSGPNQSTMSTIPLQLQLNPQAVMSGPLLASPQVEQQLQQQQILIQQQQQLLQIQIEQQKLQKQMTEQLSIRQKDDMDNKRETRKEHVQTVSPPKEVIKKDKQVSTSTPPSVSSTPTSAPPKPVTTATSAVTSTTKTTADSVTVTQSTRKNLHRRLPHPTAEEMQSAVQTLAAQNAPRNPSAISSAMLQQQRPISPLLPRKTQQSVISSQVILNPSTRRTNLSTATVLTTATSTLVSSAILPSATDRISPSPFAFGQSVFRSHTPITPGDLSDSLSDVTSDKGKRRRLPTVPWDEEPVSPVAATRRLIKERLAGRAAISSTSLASKRIPPLRPSSSLDSAVTGLTNSRRPQSPFSSTSDITQFLASTYGQSVLRSPIGNIRSPARSPVPAGENQIGHLLCRSSPASPTRLRGLKQQLLEELRTATEERQRLLRERDNYRRSDTDLYTNLVDIYSSPVRRRRGRYKKNASDSRIFRSSSPFANEVPFKSYEFESLPASRTFDVYRSRRPTSSLAYDEGLRESVIPNMMDTNDNSLYLLNRNLRRRSDGSPEMLNRLGYGLDPYGRSSSNFYFDDLTQHRRRLGPNRGTRSWNPSPYVSEDEDDHLTREEKAARVRAEIKRRRQQMADSSGRFYRHSVDGSGFQDELWMEDEVNFNVPKNCYDSRLRHNYSQPSLHGHDNLGYEYDCRRPNARDAALLRRPNFAHPDMNSLMSESDTPSDVFGDLHTPAMPILPDMPTRSRKLLEDLGAGGQRETRGGPHKRTQFADNVTRKVQKYPFPVKRILLTQDPKIRSVSGNGLGLKVVGGQQIPGTQMVGAMIQKIHPSLTMMGEIREGMQVIEWNGIPLTGISHDEVSHIIQQQVGDEIEVVIRTDVDLQPRQFPQVILQHNHPVPHDDSQHPTAHYIPQTYPAHAQSTLVDPKVSRAWSSALARNDPSGLISLVLGSSARRPPLATADRDLTPLRGRLQLHLFFDRNAHKLFVTVLRAKQLRALVSGHAPDPFVRCYLLPPRIVNNQRLTRHFYRSRDPKWKQTMVFTDIGEEDLTYKYLELSVWSSRIYAPHVFLGQTLVRLSSGVALDCPLSDCLEKDSQWFALEDRRRTGEDKV